MEFTIYNRDGEGLFYTAYECCVPLEHLDSMASVGLTFYVDGKKMSVSAIRNMFKGVKPVKVPKYEEAPVPKDDEDTALEVTKIVEPKAVASSSKTAQKTSKTKSLVSDSKPAVKIDFKKVGFPITSRCVVCMNTGKVYKNQSEAAKDLGVDPAYISDCVCHDKAYKGYRFKKAVDLQ